MLMIDIQLIHDEFSEWGRTFPARKTVNTVQPIIRSLHKDRKYER